MAETLAKLAFQRTKSLLKLDKPLLVLISAFGSAGIAWWATGNPAWGGLAGLVVALLMFLPTYAYSLVRVSQERFNEGSQAKADAEALIAAQVDPDGLYQHGRKVATTQGGDINLGQSVVTFTAIEFTGDFNRNAEFSYRDLTLRLSGFRGGNFNGAGVNRSQGIVYHAQCAVQP